MKLKPSIACAVALTATTVAARGQLMKMLVSTDGVNFSSSVNAHPGDTIQVLVTVSYTGTSPAVAGFGSADFQPTVSNWHATDSLLPLLQGGNELPADGSGMVAPQFYTGVTNGDSAAAYGHIHAGYVPGTYGRVLPMGRSFLDDQHALTGFVHANPDGSGLTYLRIAQANNPAWIGAVGSHLGGVNPAQLFVIGRSAADPDFWGNRDTINVDPTDPINGWDATARNPANDDRRVNVELFRFGFVLDSTQQQRVLTIDAPLAGTQGYIGYYTSTSQVIPSYTPVPVVQTGSVHVLVPAPGAVLGVGLIAVGRRRRSRTQNA